MVGFSRCNDCKKWKAHKAFVRSRVRRDSELWVQNGFMWHKYKSCNHCFRIYRNRGMSVNKFIQVFGAEEHDLSEPEILIDEVEAEDFQGTKDIKGIESVKETKDIKDIQDEPLKDAKDNNIQVDGAELEEDAAKLSEKDISTEDKEAEDAAAKDFRLERLLAWRVNQPFRPKVSGQEYEWIPKGWPLTDQSGGDDKGANAPKAV